MTNKLKLLTKNEVKDIKGKYKEKFSLNPDNAQIIFHKLLKALLLTNGGELKVPTSLVNDDSEYSIVWAGGDTETITINLSKNRNVE